MKETIKELKKEIEEKFKMTPKDYQIIDKVINKLSQDEIILLRKINENNERKAKLQTLQEVCKEIDKQIENYKKLNKKFPKNQTFIDMWTSLFALQLRLEGKE